MNEISRRGGTISPTGSAGAPLSATVIIPSHGRPEMLGRCLASLKGQAHPRYEVLVVDDASPQREEYAAIARRYGARLLRNPTNLGQAAARNRAVRESTGDVVIFLDDDCVVRDPDWIGKHVRMHAAQPDLLVGGGIDNVATTLAGHAYASTNPPDFRAGGNLQAMNLSLSRRTFLENGPFREDFRDLEDLEFSIRAQRRGKRLLYAPHIRVTHHLRTTLNAFMRRLFQHGFWVVPVGKANRIGSHRYFPGSLASALVLFMPLVVTQALMRIFASLKHCSAAVVYLPILLLYCFSYTAGIVWYHWTRRRTQSARRPY